MSWIDIIDSILIALRQMRASKISRLCQGFIQYGHQILDLGSGNGLISEQIKKDYNAKVICLDVVNHNRSNLQLILYDGRYIPFKEEKFDTILLFFVLHHTLDAVQVLREAKRILKNRGNIIILEDIYMNKIERWITIALDAIYNRCFNLVKTPFNFKTMEEWNQLFKELGLTVRYKKSFHFQEPEDREALLFYPPSVMNIQFVLTKQL